MRFSSPVAVSALFIAVLSLPSSAASAKDLNWTVGPCAYSFRLFTFFDAVDKAKEAGMAHTEAFEGQKVSPEIDRPLNKDLSDEDIAAIRKKLDDSGVTLTSIYIHNIPADPKECEARFAFAKKLGVKAIVSEPEPAAFDVIEKCCKKYKIAVAIHNHPQGRSRYWHPKEVLKVCEGRSKWIGACGDSGHWTRSGLDPVECVQMLGNRLLTMHVKDLNVFGDPKGHDLPWGTGKGNVAGILAEVDRLGLEPIIFGIEYEHNWENSLPEIRKCGEFCRKQAAELGNECE